MLSSIPAVTYLARSNVDLYVEVDKKKTCSFFSRLSPLFAGAAIATGCRFSSSDIIEQRGVPLRVVLPDSVSIRSEPTPEEKLFGAIYKKVRLDSTPPDFTGNVHFMLNRDKYQSVMSYALVENAKDEFDMTLRPWKKMVVKRLEEQCDRKILWVFDYDGNTGKTRLGRYLMMKKNFQILFPGSTHNLCSMLNPFAAGFVFDCSRNAFSSSGIKQMNELYDLLEQLKNRFVVSGKYQGSLKIPTSNKVLVFGNQIPILERLSLDRWDFFHTKLGYVLFFLTEGILKLYYFSLDLLELVVPD